MLLICNENCEKNIPTSMYVFESGLNMYIKICVYVPGLTDSLMLFLSKLISCFRNMTKCNKMHFLKKKCKRKKIEDENDFFRQNVNLISPNVIHWPFVLRKC